MLAVLEVLQVPGVLVPKVLRVLVLQVLVPKVLGVLAGGCSRRPSNSRDD